MTIRIATIALMLSSCDLPFSTTYPVDAWVYPYWEEAQQRLIEAGIPNAASVPPSQFLFIAHEPEAACPEEDCYWYEGAQRWERGRFVAPYGQIHYCSTIKAVVIHEAGHAILWKLNYPSNVWKCWEHPCGLGS